jgi:hypothetical protein
VKLTDEQLARLLNSTIYSWDVSSRLSGIVDFLDFSERNLAWQREREVRRAEAEALDLEFDEENARFEAQARDQIVESAKLRFDIGLARNVRYAGLVAYVTAIEWCMDLFEGRLAVSAHRKPDGVNKAVHLFAHFSASAGGAWTEQVEGLRRVVYVRNCVVHNVGRVLNWKYEQSVREAIAALPGFAVSDAGFEGPSVDMAAGAVDALAKAALDWVPALDEACSRSGAFRTAA